MPKRARPKLGTAGLTSAGLGYRQQADVFDASERLQPSIAASSSKRGKHDSALAAFLLKECMWGFMPAWKTQRIAELAVIDGANKIHLVYIAEMGTKGYYKRNVWRSLKRKADPGAVGQSVKRIRIPAVLPGKVVGETDVDVLQPPFLFATL